MNLFNCEIGRDQQLMPRRHPQHSAIVPDSGDDRGPAMSPSPDSLDEGFFL